MVGLCKEWIKWSGVKGWDCVTDGLSEEMKGRGGGIVLEWIK